MKFSLVGLSRFDYFGVLLLRLGAGVLIAYHGFPILLGGKAAWEHIGSGAAIATLNSSLFMAAGLCSAIIQVFGGVCLIIGLFTRGAALLLAAVVGFALANLTSAQDFGLSFFAHTHLLLVFLGLAFVGPGRLSIDRKGI